MPSSFKSSFSAFSTGSKTSLVQKFTSAFKSKTSSRAQYKPSVPKQDESDGVDRRFVAAFDSDDSVADGLETYIQSREFDDECAAQLSKPHEGAPVSNDLWSPIGETTPSVSFVGASPHDLPSFEANLYYAGLSPGPDARGPRLIYRTSKDKFVLPTGPETYPRLMELCPVPEDHQLGNDGLWDSIRNKVAKLLDTRGIQLSSVDLVRFTWFDENNDQGDLEEDEDEDDAQDGDDHSLDYDDLPPIKPVENGIRHTTLPTIWVGVLPGTLTGTVAHESAAEILELLEQRGVTGVDVAYRESVAGLSRGPDLFAPVSDYDPLKGVIDNLSTPLSLPIAGRDTTMQGTLGFYFRVENELYAATARRVLFTDEEGNSTYKYVAGPKEEVVVIGKPSFTNYLASVQGKIKGLNDEVTYLETRAEALATKEDSKSAGYLDKTRAQQTELRTAIIALNAFFVKLSTDWSELTDRIIGHVVWAPPIGVSVLPHGYAQDLCIIKLDKKKFRNGFLGNVLSLGPEITLANFGALMYDCVDVRSEFQYPQEGLLPVQGILSANEINNQNNMNLEGGRTRRVIKRGSTTNTTVGTLIKFASHVRRYNATGNIDSTEVAILPHDNASGPFSWDSNSSRPFSRGGDSGSLIVDALGRFVALLAGGTDSFDITYSTLLEWLWGLIKDEFPGADLYFDDLEAFLSDVAKA